jgi:hypothetical protein
MTGAVRYLTPPLHTWSATNMERRLSSRLGGGAAVAALLSLILFFEWRLRRNIATPN